MKAIKMVRNLKTTEREGQTRLYFEPLVLEVANLCCGQFIKVLAVDNALVVVATTDPSESDGVISRRKRRGWKYSRPYFDRCNAIISSVLRARERIDVIIREGHITVRHERSFDLLFNIDHYLQGEELKKLRLLSLPSGMGMGTAALVNTSLYEAVCGVDFWPLAAEVYQYNFSNGVTINSDIKHIHPDYLSRTDVAFISPECDEFSPLGNHKFNVSNGLAPHYARLVWASGCEAVLIEQVPMYFKTRAYYQLRSLLSASGFQKFYETQICAHDFGSVATRKRGYAIAFRNKDIDFAWPQPPRIPDRFRKTVGQVLGDNWEECGLWKTIHNSPMEKILTKSSESNNFNVENNHTLVNLDSRKISAIISAYRRTQVTSSYLLHPDGIHWRHFTADELGYGFMGLPEWFEWPAGGSVSETRKVELIGQGVDCNVVGSIATELALSLIQERVKATVKNEQKNSLLENKKGQIEFLF